MASSAQATPTPTTLSSTSPLFPTVTASQATTGLGGGGTNPTVYYFVFLGVLLVLLGAAGCLAYRAYRLRRRYRNARQLAIARGEPLPDMRDDYWGLGGMSAWTSDGVDRITPGQEGPIEVGGGRKGKKGRWERIPVLQDYTVEDEKIGGRGVIDAQPITLHSILPPPKEPFADWATPSPAAGGSRENRFRIRTNPLIDFYGPGSLLSSRRNHRASRNMDMASPPIPPPPPEMRVPGVGESVRVAVVIKMPRPPTDTQTKSVSTDDDEEEIAWEPGMELAVWEGVVGNSAAEEADGKQKRHRRRSSAGASHSPARIGIMASPRRDKRRDSGDKG